MVSSESTRQLVAGDARASLQLLRNNLVEGFTNTGREAPGTFLVTWRSLFVMRQKINRQFKEDQTHPRYVGVDGENYGLAAFGKGARPMENLEAYAGHSGSLLGRVRRRFSKQQPGLVNEGRTSEIVEVHIAEGRRGQGLGTLVVAEVLDGMHPETEVVRVAALKGAESFYERFNFRVTDETSYWPDPTDEMGLPTVHMVAPYDVALMAARQRVAERA